MKKRKIIVLTIFLFITLISISSLDKNLRYKIGLIDYYRYNAKLTKEENKLIRDRDFLVGVYNYPPLAYTNEYNNYNTGIIIDYLSQLAIEMTNDIYTKVGSDKNLVDLLEKNELDAVVIENFKDQEARKDISLTQALCIVKSKILVKKDSNIEDINDLNNKIFAILKKDNLNGSIDNLFDKRKNIGFIEVENIYQAFALLNSDTVSGIIGDDMAAIHFLNVTNKGANFRFLDPVLYEKEIRLAVKKENSQLFNILNKGILRLKKKNLIAQTQNKWLGNFETDSIDLRTIEIAYKIIIVSTIIIGAFSSWNHIITKRVNTKTKELSQSREELCLIIETMKNGILVIEDDSIIVECNDAIARIAGISKKVLLGSYYKNIRKLDPFVDKSNMNIILNVGNFYYYITNQKINKNKNMIIVEDYTKKYLKEKKERQESKMIAVGQLSAGLAHEIRNPLGLIKSYSYIIENHNIDEICNHAISVINNSINRINNLIENLLRFSRLSNDEKELINIKSLIDSIVDVEKHNIEGKGIKISRSFMFSSENKVLINTDVVRMVLVNLINNSIDSFEDIEKEDKNISLKINMVENHLKIRIADNGCGIQTEKLDKIFDPFFSTKESGTGLGLYIISTEITNNNGKISVDSSLGEGTVFDIVLPIME